MTYNLCYKSFLYFLLPALLLCGCQVTENVPLEPTIPSSTATVTSSPNRGAEEVESNVVESTEYEPMETPEDLPLITKAKMDLAERLVIDTGEIEVLDFQFVEWPDSSLGCPQPGMVYAQVLQDGMFIQLKVDGNTYNYHSGGGRAPFLCEQVLQSSKPTPIDLDFSDIETPLSDVERDD